MAVRAAMVFVVGVCESGIPFQTIGVVTLAMAIAEHERFLEQRVSLERVELEFNIYVWRVIG